MMTKIHRLNEWLRDPWHFWPVVAMVTIVLAIVLYPFTSSLFHNHFFLWKVIMAVVTLVAAISWYWSKFRGK